MSPCSNASVGLPASTLVLPLSNFSSQSVQLASQSVGPVSCLQPAKGSHLRGKAPGLEVPPRVLKDALLPLSSHPHPPTLLRPHGPSAGPPKARHALAFAPVVPPPALSRPDLLLQQSFWDPFLTPSELPAPRPCSLAPSLCLLVSTMTISPTVGLS